MDVVWMKPVMSVALKARPIAWLSKPSDQCLQRLRNVNQEYEERPDSRQDATWGPTIEQELDRNARLAKRNH